ncbi:MAG TPA: YeeE/YedE thiosulfate transporter family protein [Cyclobacteriaceae bacterium]|nr:YeeE/YedE thiosulfate transporter family protein [Cyclobacteriaceae bacterium]HPW64048.1 YeeE/YedE thiosulfate transporter family protein [Cyclobacteriaceae bacterium]
MSLTIISLGFLFGAALQYGNLNKYNTISGMAVLEDFTVAKTIATAIGIGAILLSIEIGLGFASYHVKPLILGSNIVGGLVFGVGMAILGYCPGTLPISLGQGSLDALVGIIGGLFAGLLYTVLSPSIHEVLGPNLGVISLHSAIGENTFLFYVLVLIFGIAFVGISFWLNKIEKKKNIKWFYSGIGVAIVTCFIFASSITDRVLGASSFYPYAADVLTGTTNNDYFMKVAEKSGNWEMKFLLGAFLSGVVISLIRKEFALKMVHENWIRFKGPSVSKRMVWSFIGGFLLLFGARIAGGCTSGHIISGGMQLAVSSFVFAAFVFGSFLITGKLFYKKSF